MSLESKRDSSLEHFGKGGKNKANKNKNKKRTLEKISTIVISRYVHAIFEPISKTAVVASLSNTDKVVVGTA